MMLNPFQKRLEIVPFVTVPVGWMPCVACRDFRTQPGKMWLGYDRSGEDLSITCPVCKGKSIVERFKHVDARTGQEIDYERPGQQFVHAESFPPGHIIMPDAVSASR